MNTLQQLCDYLSGFESLTDDDKGQLALYFQEKTIPAHTTVVDLGDLANEVYFIVTGCMRYYYINDDGAEITGFVYQEGMFAGAIESFFEQVPSNQILETIEECSLLVLTSKNLDLLCETVPKMNIILRKLFAQRMVFAQRIIASLIMNKPEQRYRKYQELHPGIENHIPQHILASYMGITPVSLSRIRGRN